MTQKALEAPVTPEELLALPDNSAYELIDGKLVEKNVSVLSSWVETKVLFHLGRYCESTQKGQCWNSSLGYRIFPEDPKKIRKPDASFIVSERLFPELLQEGYMTLVPDLATEVVSDNDLAYEVDEKIEEYLRVGVKLVWEINPQTRTVMIHRLNGTTTKLHEQDVLDGEDVLPGFKLEVAKLFPQAK